MSFKRRKENKKESVDIKGGSNKGVDKTPLKVVSGVIRVKDSDNFNINMNKKNQDTNNKKVSDNVKVNNKRNISYRVLNFFVMFGIFPSALGLGVLSGLLVFGEIEGTFINNAILSSFNYRNTSELNTSKEIELFEEHVDKYKNVKALAGVENLKALLKNSALRGSDNERFILYTGTEACIWCRFTHNVDDNYLYNNVSDFVTGDNNGIIQSMNTFFAGKNIGVLNNEGVNKKGLLYELHDLKAVSVSEYHSGTSKVVSDLLLSRLDDRSNIKFVSEIVYKNGGEVALTATESGTSFTTADGYRRFHDLYTTADSVKMRENLTSVGTSIKERLIDDGTYGTPAWWFIEKGKPLYFTSTYFTIAALTKVLDWYFNDGVLV